MSYTKVVWKDYPSTATPINAANLGIMDQGIADAHSLLATAQADLDVAEANIISLGTQVAAKIPTANIMQSLDDMEALSTAGVYVADAKAVGAISTNLNGSLKDIDIRYNATTQQSEWSIRGADTWNPFSNSGLLARFYYFGGISNGGSVQMPIAEINTSSSQQINQTIKLKKAVTVKCLLGQGGEGNRVSLSIRVYKNGVVAAQYNCVDNLYTTATAPGYFSFAANKDDIIDVKFVSNGTDGGMGENNACHAVLWFN